MTPRRPTNHPMIDGEEIIPTPEPEPEIDRRSFVRRLSGDAAGMVGRLHGLSQIIAGSAAAAVLAVGDDLEAIRARERAADLAAAEPPDSPVAEPAAAGPGVASEVVVAAEPVAALGPVVAAEPTDEHAVRFEPTPEEAAILSGAREAVVAVNDGGNGAHVTFVSTHWDGETIRFGALGWARRSTLLRADGRVTLLVVADNGRYLSVRGRASLLEGAVAREAMRPLLDLDGRDWDELVAEDPDRVVVIVEPHQILSVER